MTRKVIMSLTVGVTLLAAPVGSHAELDVRSQRLIRDWVQITDRRQDLAEEQISRLIAKMNELTLTPCHFRSWQREFEKSDDRTTKALDFLKSHVADVEQTVDTLERLITSYVDDANLTEAETVQIHKLALQIASNEEAIATNKSSIDRIMRDVLPGIKREIETQKAEISDDLAVLRLAAKDYEIRFDSFCKRLQDHEERLTRLENGAVPQVKRGVIRNAAYQEGPRPDEVFTPSATPQRRTYSPDYIALKRSKICDNAKLLASDYEYRMRVDGVVKVYFGSIFKACDGRIVLVKEREPYVLGR